MFSQVCHGEGGVGTHSPQGMGIFGTGSLPGVSRGGYSPSPGVGMSRGGVGTQPPSHTLDTTGCGQKAGGTHPTGMLSCFVFFLNRQNWEL